MPENKGEATRLKERAGEKAEAAFKQRELKARKQFADSMRLAAELRVKNQDELTRVGRNWADRLFDTKTMSETEFQGWRNYGVRFFGEKAGTAADLARAAKTTRKDGLAVSNEQGRIIAKDRRGRFAFTANPLRPRVTTAATTEFAGIAADVDNDPGSKDAITKDGVTLGGPGDMFDDMSRKARTGGLIDKTITGHASRAKARVTERSGTLNLTAATRGRAARAAGPFATELDISGLIADGEKPFKVEKVATPEPTEGNDELDIGATATPLPEPTGGGDEGDSGAGPMEEPNIGGDTSNNGRPWSAPGPVSDATKRKPDPEEDDGAGRSGGQGAIPKAGDDIFEIRPPGLQNVASPILDEDSKVVIGYRYEWQGVVHTFDVDGKQVGMWEPGLEEPLFSPLDVISFGKVVVVSVRKALLATAIPGGVSKTPRYLTDELIATLRATYRGKIGSDPNLSRDVRFHLENEEGRYVPVNIMRQAIRYGKATPDPRGSPGIMYRIGVRKYSVRKGYIKDYELEILYDKKMKMIHHVLYKDP